MDTIRWTLRREHPLSTEERLLLQSRRARFGGDAFELFLTPGGPVVAAGQHHTDDAERVLREVQATAEGLGVDVVVGDPMRWPQPSVRTDELRRLPELACAQLLLAMERGEDWAERALMRFGPEDVAEAWLGHYRLLQGAGASAGWRAVRALGAERFASRVLALWDAAEARAERNSLCNLLGHFVAVPEVEARLARDYLFSLRAGDRYLAQVLTGGSERVAAVYAQVILRRLQEGRGLARYAVRHLAQRGDGLRLLGAVLASDRFTVKDKLEVLAATDDRAWWAAMLPTLATEHGVLPRTDEEGLAACLVHPEAAVRQLARRTLALEGRALPLPRGRWEDHLARWGVTVPELSSLFEAGVAEGLDLVQRHGLWLHGLRTQVASLEPVPRRVRPRLAVTLLQSWEEELVRFRVAPAPASSRPRLTVTLRDAGGRIVDLFDLTPVRFEGTVAVFEAWRVGRRAEAVSAEARLRDPTPMALAAK